MAEYDAHNNKKKWQLLIVGKHFVLRWNM